MKNIKDKKAEIKNNKAKINFIKKSQGRKPPIPQNQVIPDKSKEQIRKNKFNNGIKELLKEEEQSYDSMCRPQGGRDGSGMNIH